MNLKWYALAGLLFSIVVYLLVSFGLIAMQDASRF